MTWKGYFLACFLMAGVLIASIPGASATFQVLLGTKQVAASSPTLVAHRADGLGQNGGTTGTLDTTGATFLVVCGATFGPNAPGVMSDSKGNTWTAIHQYGSHADTDAFIFVCYSPVVGSGHTFTYNSGGTIYASVEILAFSGITTSAFNAEAGASTSSSATHQPGSITPSVGNTLLITVLAINDNSGGALSVDSGFTLTDTLPFTGGSYFGSGAAYKVLTSAAATNPTWNLTNATLASAGIAAFAY